MMPLFVPFLSSLFLFLTVLSHASNSSPQTTYWNSILPHTPMPTAISDLLLFSDEKYGTRVSVGKGGVHVSTEKGKHGGTSVNVGKGGVTVVAGKGKPGGTSVGVGKGGVHVVAGKGKPGGTTVNVGGKGGVHVSAGKGKPGGGTTVNVGHGGVNVNTGRKGKPPVIVGVNPGHPDPFQYRYAATETQIHDDPRVTLFFLEHNLHHGAKMNLQFTKTTAGASFLSRQEANSIPFTSTQLPEILHHFSIEPNSAEAEAMKKTLQECEEPAASGEEKYCATSLESMVDYSVKSLGTNDVKAISTSVSKEDQAPQQYTVLPNGVKKMTGDKLLACHAEFYAYAVFYCHQASPSKSKAYAVMMEGKDGAAPVDAVAVCHYDTKAWNPEHVAFKLLKVMPGSVPICHFLPQDHVVWSRNTISSK